MSQHKILQSLISKEVPVAHPDAKVSEIEELLVSSARKYKSIDYIYLVDDAGKLESYLPIKNFFQKEKETKVKTLIRQGETQKVHPDGNPHKAALKAIKNELTSIAVTDKDNNFLGAIVTKDLLNIIDTKSVENVLRMGGVSSNKQDTMNQSLSEALKHRLPWLFVGMAGGFLTASIFGLFETTLSENLVLAAFVPLVVYMADAVASQMEAFIIRDLAVDNSFKFSKYIKKQFKVVTILAGVLSLSMLLISLIFYRDLKVNFVIAVALFIAILSSLISGVVVPFTFQKLHLDPADASGPVATIIQDITSVLIYFGVAALLL